MNSSMSTICVQLASLLSRTPNCADIASPEAQIPLKPASRTRRAERPLCASMRNSSRGLVSISRRRALRVAAMPVSSASVSGRCALSPESLMAWATSQLRQDLVRRALDIGREVDLDPRPPGDVRHAEPVAGFAQQVPHRFLVGQRAAAAAGIVSDDGRQAPRAARVEPEEPDGFTDGVVLKTCGQLLS